MLQNTATDPRRCHSVVTRCLPADPQRAPGRAGSQGQIGSAVRSHLVPPPGAVVESELLGPSQTTASAEMSFRHDRREHQEPASSPTSGLDRLICARSNAVARRVTQDHAGPFCTIKLRTARGFCANLRGSGQTGLLARSQVGQLERKEEMKAYPQDAERLVKRRTSLKD
jgi:hypothetical protein